MAFLVGNFSTFHWDHAIVLGLGSNRWRDITLWLFNIAMENSPFIDGLPIKNGDFPWLC